MPARRATKRWTTRTLPAAAGLASAWPWLQLSRLWLEIGWAAPQVIAHRTFRMLHGGPFPARADRDEFRRMFDEKAEAWIESTWRMSSEMGRQWFAIAGWAMQPRWLASPGSASAAHWRSAWSGAARQWTRSAPRIAHLALGPVHRRVTANARRLGRRSG
ncbi:MAG: hypothetical protein H3C59_04215 [Burkholderiaceae bacterium]|nr:hypothetical protein [Burkholderiaceae bacterium]